MASAKDLKGTRLGRYTLVEHLATGGMAEIFLATYEAAGGFRKELVLKILQPRWAENQAVVDMFMREARITARLNHLNIVDVYDVASEDGTHFIAMEYIRGKPLTELARRAIEVWQVLQLDVGAHIVAEVAAALVKLIDFGIARQGAAVEEASGARPGKASYMSPEQAQGVALDGRSDIFSLGTILYEITVGRRLWRGTRASSIRRIIEEKPAPPTYVRHDYPTDLEMVVMRALEKKPEDLQCFLRDSGAQMRSHHQLAHYFRELYSPEAEAQITEDGLRQARLFAEGDEDSRRDDVEALDFDQASAGGPGAALARALRAAGSALTVDGREPADFDEELPSVEEMPRQHSAVPAATKDGQVVASNAPQIPDSPADSGSVDAVPPAFESVTTPRRTPLVARAAHARSVAAHEDTVPRSVPLGAVLFVAVLLAAAVAGLVWLLRSG